jgi:hypothetical protein
MSRDEPSVPAARLASTFAICSFFSVAAGCFVAASNGTAASVWGRNAAAWVVGGALAYLLARMRPAPLLHVVLVATPVALLVSLLSTGQSGVHRWIHLGPLHWNAALLFLPAAIVALTAAMERGWRWTWWAVMAIAVALCVQPDASQATAFAAAIAAVSLPGRGRLLTALLVALAAFAWTRPDPLLPVPEVEGIVALAVGISGGVAALCVASLVAMAASPLMEAGTAARALSVYFAVCVLMPMCGAYPVPLTGMGMSPILGFWVGIGTLLGCRTVDGSR